MNLPSKKTLYFAGGIAAFLLLVFGYGFWSASREPSYNGRSFSTWFRRLTDPRNPLSNPEALEAMKQMGPEAVPLLVRQLEIEGNSKFARAYWKFYIRTDARWRRFLPAAEMQNIHRDAAVFVLTQMGAQAQSAVPQVLTMITHEYEKRYKLPLTTNLDWTELFLHPPTQLYSNNVPFSLASYFRQQLTQITMCVGGDNPDLYPMMLASAQENEMTGGRGGAFWPYLDNTNLAPAAKLSEKLLLQASTNHSGRIRLIATCGLGLVAGDDPDIEHTMLKAIEDSDVAVRFRALQRLGAVPIDFNTALEVVWRMSGDTNTGIINSSKAVLHTSGGGNGLKYIGKLRAALDDTNAIHRAVAAKALGDSKHGMKLAKDRLKQLTDPALEPDEQVREAAAETLSRIGM